MGDDQVGLEASHAHTAHVHLALAHAVTALVEDPEAGEAPVTRGIT